MAFVGSLMATVTANTKPFEKRIKKARKVARDFGARLKKLAVGAGKFGAALGAVAIGALVVYTVKAFKAIDVTAKLAHEMEIATEKLIGYELAAGLSGVSSELLFKAIGKMAKIVGEAKSGISTGTKALEDFGLELKEIEGLTTSQVFEKFADKISAIPDPMERAAKASLIFGRAGGKLLNFFSLGSAGLAKVKAEADALGISFSAIDAAKVEAANDAILRMQTVAKGVGNTIAVQVAPFVEVIATKMAEFVKEAGGIDTIVNKHLKKSVEFIGIFIEGINLATAAFKTMSAVWKGAAATVVKGLDAVFASPADIKRMRSVTEQLKSNNPDITL